MEEEKLLQYTEVKMNFLGKEKVFTNFNTECIEPGSITEIHNLGPLSQLVRETDS